MVWKFGRKEGSTCESGVREYAILFLITGVTWCCVAVFHKIYPFGDNLMDIGDMGASVVPLYTFWWDVLHGNASPFFSWRIAFGNNMAAEVWHFGLLSPVNLLLLLVKRESIEKFLFLFLLIKLFAVAGSICFVLRKWFPVLEEKVRMAFSLLYIFSPFAMQYYYFPAWLDMVFMFPVVMYFYFRLLKERKARGYIISLFFFCIMSFQHIYMLIILLIFLTGILCCIDRRTYRESFPMLLGASIVAGGMGAFIWLPGLIQAMKAARMGGGLGLAGILNSVSVFSADKWLKLVNLGVPLLFFGISVKRMGKKSRNFFLYIIGILALPVLLESTNMLWHGGSYNGYTMRFSYMLTFWVLIAGLYGYLQIAGKWREKAEHTGRGKKYGYFLVVFAAAQSLALGTGMVKVSWSIAESYIAKCNDIYKKQSGNVEPLRRIKSLDAFLNHNFPFIMGKNAGSNYLAAVGQEQLEAYWRMGHARVGLRMCDYGGTLFTDALSGVYEVYSSDKPDEELYFWKNGNLYGSKYTYGVGILIDKAGEMPKWEEENPFFFQNRLAKQVTGRELFDVSKQDGKSFGIYIEEKSLLYLYVEEGKGIQKIRIADRRTGEERQIGMHGSGWQNGIVELGIFHHAELEIQIDADEELPQVVCAVMPVERFVESQPVYAQNVSCNGTINSLDVRLNNPFRENYLFLPVYADQGWKCLVNGKRVELEEAGSLFMAIPLEEGENRIMLMFKPTGLAVGIVLTAMGVILLGLWIGLERRIGDKSVLWGQAFWKGGRILWGLLLGLFYVLPLIYLAVFIWKRISGE